MPDITGKHIVDTAWLAANLGAPDLVVLDGSWHLPQERRDPKADYASAHIPGARFFDIDAVSDRTSPLPHMLAPPAEFARQMQALGVGEGDCVVVYDASAPGIMSAARPWWNFRVMGHANVAVLDGGLRKWKAEGRPLTAEPPPPRSPRPFEPRLDQRLLHTLDQMRDLVASGSTQIADARSAGRFEGRDPEPRPGLVGGHMPGAANVPFGALLSPDGTMKPPAEIRRVFQATGIDLDKPIVTTCGSGVSAAVLSLALALTGHDDTALYDGSWSEWGQEKLGLPVARGA
jgi:thiosulfate/3-mercaptopyruvate sulfurtransferase